MEIKYNDIEAFVRKAMSKNICVYGRNSEYESGIFISKRYDKDYDLWIYRCKTYRNPNNRLEIHTYYGQFTIELTNKEIALLDVLVEDVKEYEINKSINVFNTYFKDEKLGIEDLNMEEDDGNND